MRTKESRERPRARTQKRAAHGVASTSRPARVMPAGGDRDLAAASAGNESTPAPTGTTRSHAVPKPRIRRKPFVL